MANAPADAGLASVRALMAELFKPLEIIGRGLFDHFTHQGGTMGIVLTREAWKKFAPGCRVAWTEAFGNLDPLREHGVLASELLWCHFAIWRETAR